MKQIKIYIKICIILILLILCSKNKALATTNYTLEESVAYAMSLLDDNMTEHEKAFILAQYCQEGNLYDLTATRSQSAEGVLEDHKAVCAGYAHTFELLCKTAGLDCDVLVAPTAASGQGHAFNICYLDGEWSYVDVTQGVSAHIRPFCFSGDAFVTATEKEHTVKAKKTENGSTFYTTMQMAIENGWIVVSREYFDKYYFENDIISYEEEGTNSNFKYRLSTNCSRIYYDENYKYYAKRELSSSNEYCDIIKENRVTGEIKKIGKTLYYQYTSTGLVKDLNKIYYVGTDNIIYSIDLNGENKKQEYEYKASSDKIITGIFVQDGSIYYTLRKKDSTSSDCEWIKLKDLSTGITRGTYNLSNCKLNYIKTSKGIVISSCEKIGTNEISGTLSIPNTIDGLPVVGIGRGAFEELNITGTLTLPKELKYIGKKAFYKTNISKINFNSKLQSIGSLAFYGCKNLSGTLEMPDSITYIDNECFSNCNYSKIKFSNSLNIIPKFAFFGNQNLEGILELPEGIVSVCSYSFGKTGIVSAIFPESLVNISEYAFKNESLSSGLISGTTQTQSAIAEVVIKSEKMKYLNKIGNSTLYILSNTQTSKYADDKNIEYKDLRTTVPVIKLSETVNIPKTSKSYKLEYTTTPKFFECYDTTWKSSNINIAKVDSNGNVTPVNAGKANIYLTINNKQVSCVVNVIDGNTISGTVTSYNDETKAVNIQLLKKGESKVAYQTSVIGNNVNYTINNVEPGTYIMKVMKERHVTREYEITVGTSEVKQDVKICLLGDVNQDGKVNVKDWNRMNEHINKTNPLTGYELLCFDVNEDGKMNAKDWNRMNEHVNKTNPL